MEVGRGLSPRPFREYFTNLDTWNKGGDSRQATHKAPNTKITKWRQSSPSAIPLANWLTSPACFRPRTFACSKTYALSLCRGGIRISIAKSWNYGYRRSAVTTFGKKIWAAV